MLGLLTTHAVESARGLAAFDSDQIIGTAGTFAFALTVPGAALVPAARVSWVAVVPTCQRQGVLRAMMQLQLRDVRERGEPLAVLLAAESGIYGRFGYGPATRAMSVAIARAHARFTAAGRAIAAEHGGLVQLITHEEALAVLPSLYRQARGWRAGTVARDEALWRFTLRQPQAQAHEGLGPRFRVVYRNAAGEVEGAVYYRIASRWEHALPRSALVVEDLFALSPAARAALWSYCLTMGLVETVRAERLPVDDALHWLLADPRRLRVTQVVDDLWVQLVDVPRALVLRRYGGAGRVVLEVRDTVLPEVSGRYALEAEAVPEGLTTATCHRTKAAPDLELEVADLGAVYLGGDRFRTLADAGRVRELTPGAVARADTLFATACAPFCGTDF